MKLKDLNRSIEKFEARFDKDRIGEIDNLLQKFYHEFPIDQIDKMDYDDYMYGRKRKGGGPSFCYWLEKPLYIFGRISGSNCSQYGAWYGTRGQDKTIKFRHTKKYGQNLESAFKDIIWNITDLLKHGKNKDYEKIAASKFAAKFKGKLLTTYYPEDYLSIYAEDYLDDILKYFNLDDRESLREAPIYKQLRLMSFKAQHKIMAEWSIKKFAIFLNEELNHYYNPKTATPKKKDRIPQLIDIALVNAEFNDSELDESHKPERKKKKSHKKKAPDYLKKSRRAKAIGNRGEQIVFLKEKSILEKAGRKDLSQQVEWISRETDGQGYDVHSFELDGTPKQIEVKATTKARGPLGFFLTDFEHQLAVGFDNYYVYIVYETLSKTPDIWRIKQPFHPQKEGISMFTCVHEVFIQPR